MKLVFLISEGLISEGQTFIYQLNKGSGSQIFAIDSEQFHTKTA